MRLLLLESFDDPDPADVSVGPPHFSDLFLLRVL